MVQGTTGCLAPTHISLLLLSIYANKCCLPNYKCLGRKANNTDYYVCVLSIFGDSVLDLFFKGCLSE